MTLANFKIANSIDFDYLKIAKITKIAKIFPINIQNS